MTVRTPDTATAAAPPSGTADEAPGSPPATVARLRRLARSRLVRWLAALVGVLVLVLVTLSVLVGRAAEQVADDPRSSTDRGTGALAQLLRDQGVDVSTTDDVDDAVRRSDAATTLVVADPDRLGSAAAGRLVAAAGGLVLLRPGPVALAGFGLPVTVASGSGGTVAPGCADPVAGRAGDVAVPVGTGYRSAAGAGSGCYRTGAGYALLRVTAAGHPVDLVAGGLANESLAATGNASLGLGLLGARPRVLWLMAPPPAVAAGPSGPRLLPAWWEKAAVQALLAVLVLGVWRGRRLGPLLTEPLPVTVRASETVEGHGRLYARLRARDHAARVLTDAARTRLSRSFGHSDDLDQLSAVLAARTGRHPRAVRTLLSGDPPQTDEELTALARDLDHLEQETRRL